MITKHLFSKVHARIESNACLLRQRYLSIYTQYASTHERASGMSEYYIIQLHQSQDVPHQSHLLVPRMYTTAAW